MGMLKVSNLTVAHGQITVLRGLSLQAAAGQLVAILGANGAGKSSLLGTLAGLYSPRAGEVYLEGRPVTGRSPEYLVRRGLVLVPERRQVFASLSVRDNLLLGAYHRRRATREVQADLNHVLELFPLLQEKQNIPAGTLSGGLQQMVAIGRGLMAKPKVLMLDEPSVGLAPLVVREIMNVLTRLKQQGKTILLVEQNARAALKVADRAWIMERGRMALEGCPRELMQNPQVQRAYLGRQAATGKDIAG